MTFSIIILSAGEGKRMGNQDPKVLYDLTGKPLIAHVLATAQQLQPDAIHIVCGYGAKQVQAAVEKYADGVSELFFHHQTEQIGTAHAVRCADSALGSDHMLVMYGDVPALRAKTLRRLSARLQDSDLVVLTANVDDPYGYGRIIRDSEGKIIRVVEEKDAMPEEKLITEINTGVIAARSALLRRILAEIGNNNTQGEYYLTDSVAQAVQMGISVKTQSLEDAGEARGVNTLDELQVAERYLQHRYAKELMRQGCRLRDVFRIDIRGSVTVENDVAVDLNVLFEGQVKLFKGVRIGANCVIKNSTIGEGTIVNPFTIIENSNIGKYCAVGPYARIRPEVTLDDAVRIGNFVEIKKSHVRNDSKINHLSYIGDSEIGKQTNIGAGTITCNYDGLNKHRTIIGDNVFVGSGTQIVAPVTIHDRATIAAGSTVTKDAKPDALTTTRGEQRTIDDWQRPAHRKE